MPKKLWFKAKRYGWGWYPSSWEGWLVLFVYCVFLFLNFRRIDAFSHSASDTLRPYFIQLLFATAVLVAIAYVKGEPPRWRWGKKG
jgi:hypothetical protein